MDFPQLVLQRTLSFQQDPSVTPHGVYKLNYSCGARGRSPKVSNLETSLAIALAQGVLSICLEKSGLDIVAHSLRYAPERRSVGTTFNVEYTRLHRLEAQAIPASEILKQISC